MTPIIYGFTGTKHGMTRAQIAVTGYLFFTHKISQLHHGCCMGADIQANTLAVLQDIETFGHPSNIANTQRSCELTKVFDPYPPLERDKHIVEAGEHGLIATPKTAVEQIRSGTWSTVRYARQANRPIWIICPDGTVKHEPAKKLSL